MSFTTITLRNLDSKENKEVVKILESFMSKRDIKTGQRAIEEIIKEYAYIEEKFEDEKELRKIDNSTSDKRIRYLTEENQKYKDCFELYQKFNQTIKNL